MADADQRYRPLEEADLDTIAKAVFISDRSDSVDRARHDLGDRFHVIPGSMPLPGGSNGEVALNGVNKGAAILEVLGLLGRSAEDAVGIGDSWNDVEMFEVCGVSVAMGAPTPSCRRRPIGSRRASSTTASGTRSSSSASCRADGARGWTRLVITGRLAVITGRRDRVVAIVAWCFHLKGELVPDFQTPPLRPFAIAFDAAAQTLRPEGPTLTRRMSDLEGLFRDADAWAASAAGDDPIVYTVVSSPVPEVDRELPQSITTIQPGSTGGELWMTKGHQHPDFQGEIYLALAGSGGLLMYDGARTEWLDMQPGTIGYIPPGWAHRSVNTGDEPYSFLAVYPGGAGHDYGWVLDHGMGSRVFRGDDGVQLRPFFG